MQLSASLCTVCKYVDIQMVTPLMERIVQPYAGNLLYYPIQYVAQFNVFDELEDLKSFGPSGSEVESFQNRSQ